MAYYTWNFGANLILRWMGSIVLKSWWLCLKWSAGAIVLAFRTVQSKKKKKTLSLHEVLNTSSVPSNVPHRQRTEEKTKKARITTKRIANLKWSFWPLKTAKICVLWEQFWAFPSTTQTITTAKKKCHKNVISWERKNVRFGVKCCALFPFI